MVPRITLRNSRIPYVRSNARNGGQSQHLVALLRGQDSSMKVAPARTMETEGLAGIDLRRVVKARPCKVEQAAVERFHRVRAGHFRLGVIVHFDHAMSVAGQAVKAEVRNRAEAVQSLVGIDLRRVARVHRGVVDQAARDVHSRHALADHFLRAVTVHFRLEAIDHSARAMRGAGQAVKGEVRDRVEAGRSLAGIDFHRAVRAVPVAVQQGEAEHFLRVETGHFVREMIEGGQVAAAVGRGSPAVSLKNVEVSPAKGPGHSRHALHALVLAGRGELNFAANGRRDGRADDLAVLRVGLGEFGIQGRSDR
jgi:hypothetical protein